MLDRTAFGRLIRRRVQSISVAAKITSAIVGACCLAMLIVAMQIAADSPRTTAAAQPNVAHADRPPSAARHVATPTAPDTVAREFLAAISNHDWPEVWNLGGKNIGRGSYATYSGMITGYRGTIRDVPTTLNARGHTVSGEFIAYETGGRVSTYDFAYVVKNGAIVSAQQHRAGTTRQS